MSWKCIKPDVALPSCGVSLELLDGLLMSAYILGREGYRLTITSLGDGKHRPNSKHYTGDAADLRTNTWGTKTDNLVALLTTELTPRGYDVVLEKDHLHIEYDPRA